MFLNYTHAWGQNQNYLSLVLKLHITNNSKEFMWGVRDSQCSIVIQNNLVCKCWLRCSLHDWWLWIHTSMVSIPQSPFTMLWENEWCNKIKHHLLHLKIIMGGKCSSEFGLTFNHSPWHLLKPFYSWNLSVYSCHINHMS